MSFSDRYSLHDHLASGGMATVHLGRMRTGEKRVVAIKQLHPHLSENTEARGMFLDEARISARIRHAGVVAMLDVVADEDDLYLVMEYVHGVSLSFLVGRAKETRERLTVGTVVRILVDVLDGLQGAHEATAEDGAPLGIVHRDISPQNVMVGADGHARVVDFGIAKAAVRLQTTREGQLKGKFRYMAPEQFLDEEVDARTDVYSAGVVLWELLTGDSLFVGVSEGAIVAKVLEGVVVPPSRVLFSRGYTDTSAAAKLDSIVLRALAKDRAGRFASCREMADALRALELAADASAVSQTVELLAGDVLRERQARVTAIEEGVTEASSGDAVVTLPRETSTLVMRDPEALAEASPAPNRASPTLRRLTIVAIAVVILGGVTAAWRAQSSPTNTAPTASTIGVDPAPVVSAATPPLVAASVPSALASSSSAIPLPSASAPVAMSSRTHAKGRSDSRVKPPASTPVKGHPRANCDPMFTVDANGIRRVKPECL